MKAKSEESARNKLSDALHDMKSKIKVAKHNYFNQALPGFLKSSPRKFWNYLSPKNSRKKVETQDKDFVTADSLNHYFKSAFTVDDNYMQHINAQNKCPLDPLTITEAGVLNLLLSVDTKKSNGPDNIPNAFLKRYAELVAKYLVLIFNK